ncbi:MAG: HNH endonuclease, partial [Malacoplasma sp.]|nr:HNH endonuclease [Malacoplasma sp.]
MNKKWTRGESILALALYFELPFGCLHKANKRIIELAEFIHRTPSSVSMKLCNFARFDPELAKRGISGLKNGSHLDEEIWNEFFQNTEALLEEVDKINGATDIILTNRDAEIEIPQGAEDIALTKIRKGQTFFRNTVLSAYNYTCCVTGIDLPNLLQASHIKSWKDSEPATERNNPSNGLCLNYLHHKAFDSGYI